MTIISNYAAIDIGSNTVQLMLAQTQNQRIITSSNHIITTRLGQTDSNKNLSTEAISATAEAVANFCEEAKEADVQKIRIIATSAVRDAGNKQALLKAIAAKTAVPIEILSGEEEALMSYRGARASLNFPLGTPVLDVGGSSTELIYQLSDKEVFCTSADIGAVRMYTNNWSRDYLQQLIAESFSTKNNSYFAVGIGGTITAIAGVVLGLFAFERETIEGSSLYLPHLEQLLAEIQPLSLEARHAYSPLLAQRAEIIEPGLLIWLSLMERLNLRKILVCGGGILDGAIVDML